jgi:hypothetical protein
MNRKMWTIGGVALAVLVLAAGAFVIARLLTTGSGIGGLVGGGRVKLSTGDGTVVDAEWVPAEEAPDSSPDVAGAYAGRKDNSILVDETEGGFLISGSQDDGFTVANTTGRISEVVVTGETVVYVDVTLEDIDRALSDGQIHQTLKPGDVEEIGELSFVQAWGDMRGDRLIAELLLFTHPPVLSR